MTIETFVAILGVPAALYFIFKKCAKIYFYMHHSLEEKYLLKGAEERGDYIHIMQASIYGKWVQIGNKGFLDKENREYQEKYLSALENLHAKGLVRMESIDCYCLTSSGYDAAKTTRLKTTVEVEKPSNKTEHDIQPK